MSADLIEAARRKLDRRGFLKGAALGGAAAVTAPAQAATATTTAPVADPAQPRPAGLAPPTVETTDREDGLTYSSCGGDYMVDVIRSLGIEYFAATPGNTFMGLHEAVINYGMVTAPNLRPILTMHEEASVAMAHGYAKIEGKPMACAMHAGVGLQHASMAIYNAYVDRVPIFMIMGHSFDATRRKNYVEWLHSATDGPGMVRNFTKWDDTPGSLRHFSESAVRAFKFSMTPPYGPTLLAIDTLMQEDQIPGGAAKAPPIPRAPVISPPAGEEGAVRETARLLVAAEHPVIFADRCARTEKGMGLLVDLAEALQAPVCDSSNRMNFPWRHPLNQTSRQPALLGQADLLLALEPSDPFALVSTRDRAGDLHPILPAGARKVTISSVELTPKANYQNLERFPTEIDLAMAADAEATLPALIEEVRRQLPSERRAALEARGQMLAAAHLAEVDRSKRAATFGWDDSPVSTARLSAELWDQLRHEDWSLVSDTNFQSRWPQWLWKADKPYQYIGGNGAQGIGYMAPAGLGAALANQKHGRLSVSIVGDGEMMFGPGVLWTAAHEQIPVLYVMHNNRAYHMEIMQMQAIANRRQRGVDRVGIGCAITNPDIDFAALARAQGVYAEGPIDNPRDLAAALKRAIAVVKKGEPALLDVVSQGR